MSAVVVNAYTGALLYAQTPDRLQRPASLTKMMTLLLAFEALEAGRLKLNDAIVISRKAARQPASRLGIAAGRSLPVKAALSVIAVESANDVAVALAEKLAGSESRFAQRMTAKARQLGMRDTRFANATGLTDPGNRTTARNMATLSVALIRQHPRWYSYFSTPKFRWQARYMTNHNRLLGKVPGVDGIKTGYTADAGYNLAASAKRKGTRIVAVVLGERSASARNVRIANLVELGFSSPKPSRPKTKARAEPTRRTPAAKTRSTRPSAKSRRPALSR